MSTSINTILGIDAAWTEREPSGVALLVRHKGTWRCRAVAPSYDSFLSLGRGGSVNWSVAHKGSRVAPQSLLEAARALAGSDSDIVTIDMPVSKCDIDGRRPADDAISQEFGSRWCAAHTPSPTRPGKLGRDLTKGFHTLGYPVATSDTDWGTSRRLVEVYPHPALLALLSSERRIPYKVAKSTRYWRGKTVADRISLLLVELRRIQDALEGILGRIPLSIPRAHEMSRLSQLKKYEDALDAIVSAWVGTLYASGEATPLGDANAAVWCPASVVRG